MLLAMNPIECSDDPQNGLILIRSFLSPGDALKLQAAVICPPHPYPMEICLPYPLFPLGMPYRKLPASSPETRPEGLQIYLIFIIKYGLNIP